MALIIVIAVEPTIKIYLPDDDRIQKIFQSINFYLTHRNDNTKSLLSITYKKIEEKSDIPKILTGFIKDYLNNLFPEISFGIQAVDEAFDVFKNLLIALEPSQSQNALLEMLDDCFEGYAIFPGSANRRDLFNWWLLDVVPSVWQLEHPELIYTIHGLQRYDQCESIFKTVIAKLQKNIY